MIDHFNIGKVLGNIDELEIFPNRLFLLSANFFITEKRYFISVFFQSYFPAMIMVMLGGLTMWIDPKSVPARVSMGKHS